MVQSLQVKMIGEEPLHVKSKPVQRVPSPELTTLIREMHKTLTHTCGVGISACQIGESLRVFIIASHPNRRYPNAPQVKPTILINPEIVDKSDSCNEDWEGCLSIPGLRGKVRRNDIIVANYLDETGQSCQTEFNGFIARIFQHEYDHIEGKLFLDRVKKSSDLRYEDVLLG